MVGVRELRKMAKGSKIPAYWTMRKPDLLAALKMTDEAEQAKKEARFVGVAKTADKIARKLASKSMPNRDQDAARASVKGRLLRSVRKEIDAARKANPEITQEQLRQVAKQAFYKESQAVKKGEPEKKGRQKGQKPKAAEQPTITPTRNDDVARSRIAMNQAIREAEAQKRGNQPKPEPKPFKQRTAEEAEADAAAFRARMEAQRRKERPNLTAIDGGNQPLKELFDRADKIGSKYQDKSDPTDLDAKRKANEILEETGFNRAVQKGRGVASLDERREKKAKAEPTPEQRQKQQRIESQKKNLSNKLKIAIAANIRRLNRGVDDEGQPLTRESYEANVRLINEAHSKLGQLGDTKSPKPKIPPFQGSPDPQTPKPSGKTFSTTELARMGKERKKQGAKVLSID